MTRQEAITLLDNTQESIKRLLRKSDMFPESYVVIQEDKLKEWGNTIETVMLALCNNNVR